LDFLCLFDTDSSWNYLYLAEEWKKMKFKLGDYPPSAVKVGVSYQIKKARKK